VSKFVRLHTLSDEEFNMAQNRGITPSQMIKIMNEACVEHGKWSRHMKSPKEIDLARAFLRNCTPNSDLLTDRKLYLGLVSILALRLWKSEKGEGINPHEWYCGKTFFKGMDPRDIVLAGDPTANLSEVGVPFQPSTVVSVLYCVLRAGGQSEPSDNDTFGKQLLYGMKYTEFNSIMSDLIDVKRYQECYGAETSEAVLQAVRDHAPVRAIAAASTA
jgi:hypothetical protein